MVIVSFFAYVDPGVAAGGVLTSEGPARRRNAATTPLVQPATDESLGTVMSPSAAAISCNARPTEVRSLDAESRAWLEALDSDGLRRDQAIGRLHALLLREARFEVNRRATFLAHPSGGDLEDVAVQAADDAVVAILAKLRHFRGDSLFTTWARRFAQREAPATIRRRRGRNRDLPADLEFERSPMWQSPSESPHEQAVAKETMRILIHLIANELTARQREVLIALVIDGVTTRELATRLETTPGAVYKTLHDARRKLKANLSQSP
jgi:RNA polymerase sigma-70 factor, ECF subfamily